MSVLKNLTCVAVVLAVVVFVCGAPAMADNLIQNGSFETYTSGTWITPWLSYNSWGVPTGPGSSSSYLPYWTLTRTNSSDNFTWYVGDGTSQGWRTNAAGVKEVEDGNFAMEIGPGTTGQTETMSQSFSVSGGYTYNVSYWEIAKNATNLNQSVAIGLGGGATFLSGAPAGTLAVSGIGTSALSGTASGDDSAWHSVTFSFIPSASATATITFSQADLQIACVDNVSITQGAASSPEPGTLALLAAGLAGLLCYAWRKRR